MQAILTSTLLPFCCAFFYFFVVGVLVFFFFFFSFLLRFFFFFLLFCFAFCRFVIFSEAISIGNPTAFIKIRD